MHALVALCAHAVALALEAPIAPAKLQWSRCSANGATTVALLRDTEVTTAQPMWPVGTAIETCLEAVDGDAALLCLPFSTGAECTTFGLRRYARDDGGAWRLGAPGAASCRAAAEALLERRSAKAVALRCAELSVDCELLEDGLRLSGFATEAASAAADSETVAAALGLQKADVTYAGAAANKLLVEVASLDALSAATGAGPADYASVVLTASDGADRVAARVARGGADDGLAAAVATLGFYWMSRSKRDGERPLAVDFDGAALSLVLAPPPTPKFGGRKRRSLPRLPTVAVTFAAAR